MRNIVHVFVHSVYTIFSLCNYLHFAKTGFPLHTLFPGYPQIVT